MDSVERSQRRQTSASELRRHGMLHHFAVQHAHAGVPIHCGMQVEDEQAAGDRHVFPLFRLCRSITSL